MSKRLIILLSIVLAVLCFTRFWNINYTARFTRDESSDLARMHSYWQHKKITLVGPISSDNIKVFSSLTYYMQLPFAAAFDFEPVGPVVGTAFWGVLTILLLLVFYKQVNGKGTRDLSAVLFISVAVLWTPLLFTSRWAWNPHLVPFWIALALVVYNTKWRYRHFQTGLFMGMSFHHHYLALFAIGTFGLVASYRLVAKKQYVQVALLILGYAAAVLPFVVFDLRHPPGLFLNSYLQGNTSNIEGITVTTLLPKLMRNGAVAIQEITAGLVFQITWVITALFVFWNDIRNKRSYLLYSLPVLAQIVGPIVVDGYSQRYFLPAAVFVLAWLAVPRKGRVHYATVLLLAIMLVSSLWQLPKVLTQPVASPPLTVVTQSQHIIMDLIAANPEIKNANVATLTGADADSLSEKYRDLLSIRGITFRAASEYDASEHLFVITTEGEENVRSDQNVSMQIFKNTKIRGHVYLQEQPWQVYWFSY